MASDKSDNTGLIYTAWGKDGRANTLISGEGPPQLQDEDNPQLIWRIGADTREEAMQKYYTLQGWSTYKPQRYGGSNTGG